MKSIKTRFFRMTIELTLFCAVLLACAGSPAPVSAQAVSPPDELDAAIRETSNYLNKQLPKGNKLVILNVQSEFPALSEYIIDELIANTVNDRVFSVVDRQQLNTIRAELDFQMSGEVDDATAQTLGRMAGAQMIISGAISRIGDLYRLRIRALSVQSAQIEGQFNRNIPDGPTVAALVKSKATGYGGTATASGTSSGGNRTTASTPATAAAPVAVVPAQAPAPPPVPMNLKTLTVTRTSVDMSWEVVGGRTISYRVYYGTSDNPVAATLAGNTRTASYRIENLQGGNKYYFWVSTVDNGVESPKSESISAETPNTFQVGERGPAGGWIFYDKGVVSNGWRYMEAAPNDIGPAQWGANGTAVGGTNTSVGTGRANTQRIIPVLNRAGEDGAALLCSELNINGFTGWFLPSRDELNLMYTNLKNKWLGGFRDGWYWSSSEGGRTSDSGSSHMSSPDDSAWTQNFKDGKQTNTNYGPWGGYGVKSNSYSVRAVRAF